MIPVKRDENGKISPEDAERLVQNAVAQQRLEGIIMTDEEVERLRDYANGRITEAEYDAWVRRGTEAGHAG